MNFLGDFHFLRPAWLLLLPIACWLWWRIDRAQDPLQGWRSVMDPELLQAMRQGDDGSGRLRRDALLCGWLIATISLSGPTWHPEPSPFADDPVPTMVLLSANESMWLTDLEPDRMERARLKVADLAEQRRGQPTGLLAFAGTSHLVLPPTRDASIVGEMAEQISPDIMPKQGMDLMSALSLGAKTLGEFGGSLVVITDSVPEGLEDDLRAFRRQQGITVAFLAVAREETPEWDSVRKAAGELGGTARLMTPDETDVEEIAKVVASAPISIKDADGGIRWAESGWWLVPILAVLAAARFRREDSESETIAGQEGHDS